MDANDIAALERLFDDAEQYEQIHQLTEGNAMIEIRWMIRRDVPSVLDVDAATFENPWTEDGLAKTLSQRNAIGITACVGDAITGFAVYELHKSRIEIVRFAVHPAWRGQGVGRALMDRLKFKLHSQRRQELWFDLPDNTPTESFRFLSYFGFEAVQMFRGGVGERDKYRFVYSVQQPAESFHRI